MLSIKFTFHYVSISTMTVLAIQTAVIHLHSTMYLFQLPVQHQQPLRLSHLHSTMYLFQPFDASNIYMARFPFTFHYVSISTQILICRYKLDIIYIPLCIYFNCVRRLRRAPLSRFTFHYVSISTILAYAVPILS